MFTLNNILKINAICSGVTGLTLATFSQFYLKLFEVQSQVPFISTGLFLITFSIFVMYNAIKKPIDLRQIILIIWLDRLWVVASFGVVAVYYSTISSIGLILIFGVAVWVGLMAYLQNSKLIKI